MSIGQNEQGESPTAKTVQPLLNLSVGITSTLISTTFSLLGKMASVLSAIEQRRWLTPEPPRSLDSLLTTTTRAAQEETPAESV